MHRSTPPVRPYPRNSPHAAGRLVALALIANGQVKAVESARLREIDALAQLGLTRRQWHDIVAQLCDDLLAAAPGRTACTIDRATLGGWFDELDDRELQTRVIRLSVELILADGRIGPGESALLRVASEHWGARARTGPPPQQDRACPCRSACG